MAQCGANSIAIDECMALDSIGEVAQQQQIGFVGNLHVTNVLFEESENVAEDVERCLKIGKAFPGYVFGLGGPIVQHVSLARMDQIVRIYLANRTR